MNVLFLKWKFYFIQDILNSDPRNYSENLKNIHNYCLSYENSIYYNIIIRISVD